MRLLILGIIIPGSVSCRDFIGRFAVPGKLIGGSIQGQELDLAWYVATLAGVAGVSGSVDGIGTTARFDLPRGITTDGILLYVVDRGNHTIRIIR